MKKNSAIFFLALVTFFSLGTYLHSLIKESLQSDFVDFKHYYENTVFLKKGYSIWEFAGLSESEKKEIAAACGIMPSIGQMHSSGFFLLIQPFTWLQYRHAALLWQWAGQLLFFCSIWFIFKASTTKGALEDFFITLFFFFSFWPVYEQLHLGQPNFLILFLIAAALLLLKKNYPFWAGISVGIACNVREYLLIALVYAIWKNKKMLPGIMLGFIGLKLIALSCFGWNTEASYWTTLVPNMLMNPSYGYNNLTLTATLDRIGTSFGDFSLLFRMAGYVLSAALLILTLAVTRKRKLDAPFEFSLFLTLTCLVTPWLHEAHLLLLYPALIISWYALEEASQKNLYYLFIASYLLLGLKYSLISLSFFHTGPLAILTGAKTCGIVLLFCVQVLLVLKATEKNAL